MMTIANAPATLSAEITATGADAKTSLGDLASLLYAGGQRRQVRALWPRLAGPGWTEMSIPGVYGGRPGDRSELLAFCHTVGSMTLPLACLSSVILAAPAITAFASDDEKTALLPRIAAGEFACTASLSGTTENAVPLWVSGDGRKIDGVLRTVPDADVCDAVVAFARTPEAREVVLVLIDLTSTRISTTHVQGVDRSTALCDLTFDNLPLSDCGRVLGRSSAENPVLADLGLNACAALSAMLAGVARRALDISVDYARQRKQFGLPIGSFQAIKHRCVDMLMRSESADALAHRALTAPGGLKKAAISAAKTLCGEAAKANASDAIQIHGGRGFTWECETNRLYRRALLGDTLMGGGLDHRPIVTAALLDEGASEESVDQLAEFALNDDDLRFREALRSWLDRHPAKFDQARFPTLTYHERFALQRDWQGSLAEDGWVGMEFPAEYGGRGATLVQQAIYNFEINRHDNPGLANDVALAVAAPAIMHWGTDAHKRRYLPSMMDATEIWCQGYSEPEAGSDLASLSTMAITNGSDYIVTGSKIWTTIADIADFCILLVRTDPNASRHRGLSCLIMDMRAPGVTVRPLTQLNGDAEFAELILDNVRIPMSSRIGEEGNGWKVALTSLSYERATRSNAYKLDQTLRSLTNGIGKRLPHLGEVQRRLVGDKLAEVAIEIAALRHYEFLMLSDRMRGTDPGDRSSIAKLASSELIKRISHFAMEVFGGALAGDDSDKAAWAKLALTSRYYTIASGTSEVQRNVLGERVLGLPKG